MIEQDFAFPYLAHAPMEPMNAVVQFADGAGEDLVPAAQMPTVDQAVAAQHLRPNAGEGRGRHQIRRRLASAAARMPAPTMSPKPRRPPRPGGKPDPVKLVWTREDDMKGGYYRPAYLHRVKVGLDADGNIVAWQHTIVGQSILNGTPFAALVKNGVDATSVEGVSDLPYAAPNLHVDLHTHASRRAGSVVALGRPHPHGLRRRVDDRPHRRRGRPRPRRLSGWRR